MYADFSTDYHYDVENKPLYTPPKSLLSLYLDARDLYILLRHYGTPVAEITTSELMSFIIEAAWMSLERAPTSTDEKLLKLTLEDKSNLKSFFQASQIVLLIDNLEQVPYVHDGKFFGLV